MNKLLLGVGREIITPEIGCNLVGYRPDLYSTCVEDDLTATAFWFEQNGKKALAITTTVCLINTALTNEIFSKIEETFGVSKDNCILSATHTHSGPATMGTEGWGDIDWDYCNSIFIPKILAAVETAKNNKTPVKMGVGRGTSLVGINRRELFHYNDYAQFGQNPWGCFNPEMTILSFKDDNDKTVANIIHYGAHCTAAGPNTAISRDWAGPMIDALDEETGGISAFFNGPEGDVGPRLSNGQTTGDMTYVAELGKVAGDDAVRIFNTISEFKDVDLGCISADTVIPLKPKVPYEKAVEEFKKYEKYNVNLNAMTKHHYASVIKAYDNNEADEETSKFSQTLLKLGDVVLITFPFELFSEIGMRINKGCENYHVLSLACTNGNEGYFVTQDQLVKGGYEVYYFQNAHVQEYVDNADWHILQESLKNLKNLSEEK